MMFHQSIHFSIEIIQIIIVCVHEIQWYKQILGVSCDNRQKKNLLDKAVNSTVLIILNKTLPSPHTVNTLGSR